MSIKTDMRFMQTNRTAEERTQFMLRRMAEWREVPRSNYTARLVVDGDLFVVELQVSPEKTLRDPYTSMDDAVQCLIKLTF